MDDRCENTGISIYFQCRVLASKNNENFRSRESTCLLYTSDAADEL